MKTLKPMALSVLTGPYEHLGKTHLAVVACAMTGFEPGVLEHEQTLWKTLAETPGFSGALDELRPKVKSEVLAVGWAFAPPGRTVKARSVRVEVGALSKELWVVGDRQWKDGVPTEAVPFDRMPIAWDRAFGGEGFAPNPAGRGFAPVKTEAGMVHPLPNVEIPNKLVTSPRDRPTPAGFGPMDASFPKRIARAGTYDKRWLDTRFPDHPEDFDPTYFLVAPEDQWLKEPLSAGDRVVAEHMHPDKERLEGSVPALVARCFVSREGDLLRELPLKLDTLWLVPHVERMVLVFRGFTEVRDDEASDVLDILFALERPGEARPRSHYASVREKRLDRDKGTLHMLRDKDLIPEGMRAAGAAGDKDLAPLLAREGLVERAMVAQTEAQLERAREECRAMGVDPDEIVPKHAPAPATGIPDGDGLADFVEGAEKEAQKAIADEEVRRAKFYDDLRKMCAEGGIDFDRMLEQAKKDLGGPPTFSADAEIERLHEMAQLSANAGIGIPEVSKLADPKLEEKLHDAERMLKDTYRKHVHYLPRAQEMEAEHAARLRRDVLGWIAEGAPLTDRDFTGADLSGIDFSGRDLSRSFLEAAKLDGCRFMDANLTGVVFARATMCDADLTRACVKGANFGEAVLEGAKLGGGVDASEAVFARADLSRADLRGILLDKADLSGAKLEGADLTGAVAKELTILRSDFHGAIFRGARFERSNLLELDVPGVDFRGVAMPGTVLFDVNADGASFDGAELESFRVVGVDRGCTLVGASFRGANLKGAFFRGARLEGADFRDAILDAADFSKAKLKGARFDGARMREGRLMKADLTDASLEGADLMGALLGGAILRGARFTRANLFRADTIGAIGDDRTSFRGANVNFVRKAAGPRG